MIWMRIGSTRAMDIMKNFEIIPDQWHSDNVLFLGPIHYRMNIQLIITTPNISNYDLTQLAL
jgi:hypothetical protein